MRKVGLLFWVLVVAIMFFSCQSKDKCIQDFDEMVTDMEQNGDDYTSEDWKMVEASYEDFLESIKEYQDELTPADFKEIGRITARYHKVIFSMTSEALEYGLDASSNYMDGYMEEMGDGDDLDRFADDFDDLMEETIDEINEIFE